jgi:hypothetical protein
MSRNTCLDRRSTVDGMLCQPGASLTDLALGLTGLALAIRLARVPGLYRHWVTTMRWTAVAALAGFVHHGWITCSERWAGPSWAVISGMVVLAVSYLLAATVHEVLGPGQGRVFWVLRSAGLIAYAGLAVTGHAGIGAILLCEGVTMIAILALWGLAAHRRHPLAPLVIAALAASGGAAVFRALPHDVTGALGLDPVSLYHLAQIPGLILLTHALDRAPARRLATVRAPRRPRLS